MEIKKVSLIGMGAAGAFFAPRLYNWLDKGDFRIICDGFRKERIAKYGITVNGIKYDFPIITPNKKGDPADLIIIATKITDLDQAIKDIKNQVGEHTIILGIQNGLDTEERIAKVYGWDHMLYSYVRMSIDMVNGHTDYNPSKGCIYFGEKENYTYSEKVLAVKALFDECHIAYQINDDMIHGLWYKFLANVSESVPCALVRVPYGAYRESEHLNAIRLAAMEEVIAIAKAKGIEFSEHEIEEENNLVMTIRYDYQSSLHHDLKAKHHTEIESFSGTVVRFGKEMGIPTPVNSVIYHAIKAIEEHNDGLI
jgi:2-dehydropantoate 2-reductase